MAKQVQEWPPDGFIQLFFNAFEELLMTQEMFYDGRRNEKDKCKVLFIIFQLCYQDLNLHRKKFK